MAKMSTLVDDFSTTSGLWESSTVDSGTIADGQLQIVATAAYDAVYSTSTYDFTESSLVVKLDQNLPLGEGSNSLEIMVSYNSGNFIEFLLDGGRSDTPATQYVYARERASGTYTTHSWDYIPSEQVYLRLRHSSGTFYWETSADGDTWVEQYSKTVAIPAPLTALTAYLIGGYWGAETDDSPALIGAVNIYGTPVETPKTSTLTDDFATMDEVKWGGYTGGAVKVIAPGPTYDSRLFITSNTSYYSLSSAGFYDMTDDQVCVQLVKNAEHGTGTYISELSVLVDGNPANRITLAWDGDGGYMYFDEFVGGVKDETATTYNPVRHKWLRLREAGGTVYWETSIDGELWTERRSKTTSLDLSNVIVKIGTGYYGTETGDYLLFDNFNLNTGNDIGADPPFPAEELTDDFSFADESKWYGFIEGVEVNDGELQIVPTPEYEYLVSVERWNVVGSHVLFRLVQNANKGEGNWDGSGSITTELGLMVSSGNFAKFIIGGGPAGKVLMRERVSGVDNDTFFVYNPARHKWFRMREDAGILYWETSANGVTWSIQRELETSLDLSSVVIGWFGGFWDTEFDPGLARFASFNLPDLSLLSSLGWFVNGGLQWGAVDGGTVQQRNYFGDAEWLWTPIPDDPVLDPDSEDIAHYLTLEDPDQHHTIGMIWYGNALIHPNQIEPETPRYAINFVGPDLYPDYWPPGTPLPWTGFEVPIPLGTQVPPGSDGHLCVADPVTGKVFSMWQAFYDAEDDEWSCSWGGIADLHGDGRDYSGSATATNLSRYAGNPRISELIAGEIPHALFSATNMCRPGAGWVSPSEPGGTPPFVYPAQKSDGRNLASIPVEHTIVEGTRIQLDPSIDLAAIPNITPGELAIGRALQRYGSYIGDQGGLPWPPTFGFSLELSQDIDYTPYDETEPLPEVPIADAYFNLGFQWDYFGLDHIPWNDPDTGASNIRVLANWDGS